MMKSWKTTAAGVMTFLVALMASGLIPMLDGDPVTVSNWGVVGAAFMAMIGLFFARDNKVTSEGAGAKQPGE